MPTVAELTRCSAVPCLTVVDGFSGLSREICRVVRLSADRLDTSLHTGDLLLVSVADWTERPTGGAASLIAEFGSVPVAAVIVTGAGPETLTPLREVRPTPILVADHQQTLDQLQHCVLDWLEQRKLAEEQVARRLHDDLADLMRSGADAGELLNDVTQRTGKPTLLHDARGRIRLAYQPGGEQLSLRDLRAAVTARAASADGNVGSGLRSPRGVFALGPRARVPVLNPTSQSPSSWSPSSLHLRQRRSSCGRTPPRGHRGPPGARGRRADRWSRPAARVQRRVLAQVSVQSGRSG